MKYWAMGLSVLFALFGCSAGGTGGGGDGGAGGEAWGSGGGSGGGNSPAFDLDSGDALWLTVKDGKALILYTYKSSATVLIDVRATPKGATEGQYSGSRLGTLANGYTMQFDCLNPDVSPTCNQFGVTMELSCQAVAGPELVCGSTVFNKVTSADIN